MKSRKSNLLEEFRKIQTAATETEDGQRCLIPPHPELKKKIDSEMKKLKAQASKGLLADNIKMVSDTNKMGLNDGLIFPGTMFPVGSSPTLVRNAALNRAPLTGTVRVAVILVDFSDKVMTATKAHFEQLFFGRAMMIYQGIAYLAFAVAVGAALYSISPLAMWTFLCATLVSALLVSGIQSVVARDFFDPPNKND